MQLCNSPVVVLLIVNLIAVNGRALPQTPNGDLSSFKKHSSGSGSSTVVVSRSPHSGAREENVPTIATRTTKGPKAKREEDDESDTDEYDLTVDIENAIEEKYQAWKAHMGKKIKQGLGLPPNATAHPAPKKTVDPIVESAPLKGPPVDLDLQDDAEDIKKGGEKANEEDEMPIMRRQEEEFDLTDELKNDAEETYSSWKQHLQDKVDAKIQEKVNKYIPPPTQNNESDPLTKRFDFTDAIKDAFTGKIEDVKQKAATKLLKTAGILPPKTNGTSSADPAIDPATGLPYADPNIDPATGLPIAPPAIDPATGLPVAPPAIDPATGYPVAPPPAPYPAAPYPPPAPYPAPAPYPMPPPAPYPAAPYPAPAPYPMPAPAPAPAPVPAVAAPAAAPATAPALAAPATAPALAAPATAPVSKREELAVSFDGKCSATVTCIGSTFGPCCSQYGWCGTSEAYCGTGGGLPTPPPQDVDVSAALAALAAAEWEELKRDLAQKIDEMNNATSGAVDGAQKFSEDQWKALKESIGDLRNATSDNIDAVKEYSAEQWMEIRKNFEELRLAAANQVDEVEQFSDEKWESVKQSIYDTRMSVFEKAHEIKENIGNSIDRVGDKIDNKYDEFKNSTKDAYNDAKGLAHDGLNLAGDAGHYVKEKVGDSVDKVANVTGSAAHHIKEDAVDLKDDVKELAEDTGDYVDSKWDGFKQWLGDNIIHLGEKIGNDDDDSKVVKDPKDLPVENAEPLPVENAEPLPVENVEPLPN